jgi:PhzF family phenazine biosynthesis protein
MTFYLLQISSEEALSKLIPLPERFPVPDEHLGDWQGYSAVYAFVEKEDGSLKTRMFDASIEDPATGSAASTLAGYLGEKRGAGTWKFQITQGVEMGRTSDISVVVTVGKNGKFERIELAGSATLAMEGALEL